MRFPLADWIDAHSDCRYRLGSSGMAGAIRHPLPDRHQIRDASEETLRDVLAKDHGVDPQRIFLTPGATEANTSILLFLARHRRGGSRRCRVRYPEYPPLFDTARSLGWVPTEAARRVSIAVISQPRNPGGTRWALSELEDWAHGASDWLVDETFREFSGKPSFAHRDRRGCWVSGTLTKFYAADDLRVGWVIAPEEERERFRRFHGLLYDSLSAYSVAGALECLRARGRIRREVQGILRSNLAALRSGLPDAPSLDGPTYFDRVPKVDGDTVAKRCLAASVLVCPGSLFGDPAGVRLCLTQRSFPRDFAAYLAVRRRLVAR